MRSWLFTLTAAACGGGGGALDASTAGALVINEVMASNDAACADAFGEFDDWVELYNPGDADLELTGYTVTDDTAMPAKLTLPAGVVVPARGYKLLWCDDQVQGVDHLPFKLDAAGEQFAIYAPDGALIDSVAFGMATADTSFARLPDGAGEFASCAHPTCGAANGATCAAVP